MSDLGLLGIALAATLAGALLALIPGLHVYNIAALSVLLAARETLPLSGIAIAMVLIGLLIGWTVVNVIPAVFLFAPDDASAWVVTPATKLLLRGQGVLAAQLVGAGSIGALVVLAVLSPVLDELLRPIRAIVQPHLGWMLVAISGFLVLSEWPRGEDRAQSATGRLLLAWAYLGTGLLTFTLSGLLGFVLMYRSPIPQDAAYANLLPAFAGLFGVPGLLQVLLFGTRPPQQERTPLEIAPFALLRGTLTGVAGGLFAGFLPAISGGIGGLLAGHATAQWDEKLFLISQGASKTAYYAGSLLLLFVPGLGLTRGGMASMLSSLYVPYGWHTYSLAVAAVAFGGVAAFGALQLLSSLAARITAHTDTRLVASVALVLAAGVTLSFSGTSGLLVMAIACCIGLIPILIGGRRMDCLGVLLIPMTLNFIGAGPVVARWLGLL